MDSLLEKLRAAAPQARDQRDRRRRARLKERHQVRVASGQQVPEIAAAEEDKGDAGENAGASTADGDASLLNPENKGDDATPQDTQVSESEDVADRAANMLQGLRGDGEGGGERARRRRESAEDERRNRRMRRRTAQTSGSKDSGDGSGLPSLKEIDPKADGAGADESALLSPSDPDSSFASPTMPSIVVSSTGDGGEQDGEKGSSPDNPVEILG
jgi:cytokinesis protein